LEERKVNNEEGEKGFWKGEEGNREKERKAPSM